MVIKEIDTIVNFMELTVSGDITVGMGVGCAFPL